MGDVKIELESGIKAAAILTVFTGFGQKASILAILNNESYTAQADAFVAGVKLDKNKALAKTSAANQTNRPANPPTNSVPTSQRDPFPDRPGYAPQKPLLGLLKDSITMADLVGTWEMGGASVTTYVNSYSGNYAGTDTTFFGEGYTIKPDGTFDFSFTGRTGNHTVRESGSGRVTLDGGFIRVAFTSGDRKSSSRYQFIAFMTLPNGGAVLSLVPIGDSDTGLSPEQLYQSCGHANGYISCVSGEVWTLRLAKAPK